MDCSSPPLIARLRRRLSAVAWFGVVAILFKIGLATACFGDGPQGDANPVSGAATVIKAIAADTSEDTDAACWHAGTSACHCDCAHGSALLVASVALSSVPPDSLALSFPTSTPLLTPREPALRPPIA